MTVNSINPERVKKSDSMEKLTSRLLTYSLIYFAYPEISLSSHGLRKYFLQRSWHPVANAVIVCEGQTGTHELVGCECHRAVVLNLERASELQVGFANTEVTHFWILI